MKFSTKYEIPLNETFNIHSVKKAICIDGNFYIVANKRHKMIGYYLLKLNSHDLLENINNPKNLEEQFMINFPNKKDIRDVDLHCLDMTQEHKQLLVSYKSIYINKYYITLIDCDTGNIILQHETFCLWESGISSFYVQKT